MDNLLVIGKSIPRKESPDKVTGAAKYTNDYMIQGMLHARMVISPHAHARIKSIDTSQAAKIRGVRSIITGKYFTHLVGSTIRDKPIIAIDKVRYHGEPVAVVVADSEEQAQRGVDLIKVEYEPLPVVNSPRQAIEPNAPLIHENMKSYEGMEKASAVPNTNIAGHIKIRKGDIQRGWQESEVIAEENFSFPPSDHSAMETRCSQVEILPDGRVIIISSSQSPFEIKKLFNTYFNIPSGKIIVNVPLVGGAYGGKTPLHLELIAYLASTSVGGRLVKLANTREEDLITSPVHIGLDAKVRIGSTKNGRITAAEITYLFDGGAYSDRSVVIAKAAAVDCSGPYKIDNLWCDSYCMYTNHTDATAFRGFGHSELTFVMERTMDTLAKKLEIDPLELRLKNSIMPGDTSATQTPLNRSNVANLPKCIEKLAKLINWDGRLRTEIGNNKVRAVGVSCLWKNSNTPLNAEGGAVLTFNRDGSVNISCGAVEIGQGTRTTLTQIVAERMRMDINKVHILMEVNTHVDPEHWKTAASRTNLLVGRAVLDAAEDAIRQLFRTASIVLRIPPDNLDIGGGRVFFRWDPRIGIDIKDIAHGYTYPNGNSIEGQVIGRGRYILHDLTPLDPNTGRGNPGPEWTVAATAVEVEFDKVECTYEILKSAIVIDAGKVLNAMGARGQMTGGMCMGLSFASREEFIYSQEGIVRNPYLRVYRTIRYGENPIEYLVDFVETPHLEAPYGARGIGEYGVVGMPAALANALTNAAQVSLNQLPLIPERIWKIKRGGER